jgi:nickel-dependent lactate racemase
MYALDLAYGGGNTQWEFQNKPALLSVNDPVPAVDEIRFRQRLSRYLAAHPLDLGRPAVIVADKTRLCEYGRYLPVLLEVLAECGAAPGRTKVYIAYGTHASQSHAECIRAYGSAYNACRWVHHQCGEATEFVALGHTRQGTPVRLRADLVDATCLVTFGAISHHYFAGYGGGRKLIFPGLGEKRAIYTNHGLFLDSARRRLAAGCQPGVLAGNPLAEDLEEVETFRPADLAVHAILDSKGRVCDLLVGHGVDHFEAACARHAAHCTVAAASYDLVLASCGGYPKDINLIQSHKAIHHAAAFVCDGGRLIILAACADGVGSETFLPWFDLGGRDAAFDRLASHYEGNGGTALAMMEKARRIHIEMVSTLPAAVTKKIGVESVSMDQAQRIIAAHRGDLAVIPNASLLVRKPRV